MLRLGFSRALSCAMLTAGVACLSGSAHAQTSFSAHTLYTSPSSDTVGVIAHGDFNGDGREDLIASHSSNGTAQNSLLFLSNGDGTYDAPIALPQSITGIGIGDFNNDGKLDFVTKGSGNNTLNVYLGNGDGTFQAPKPVSDATTNYVTSFVVADVNHDNKSDIVEGLTTQGGPELLQVWISNGDGTFKAGQRITSGVILTDFGMVTGDFDGDGKPDVAILNTFQGPTQIQVWYGDGAGDLGAPYQVTDPNGYQDLVSADGVVDINNDGKSDLVTTRFQNGGSGPSTYVPQIELIEGNSSRTLTFVNVPISNCASGVTAADYNGDGYNDLAFAEAPCSSVLTGPFTYIVKPGSSPGTFGAEQSIYTASYNSGSDLQTLKSSQGSKPDLAFTQTGSATVNAGPSSVVLLSNTSSGNFPACNTASLAEGINVCQPSGTSANSPVTFSIASAGPTPMRTVAVWVDGQKASEQLAHAFSHYSFLDQSVTLSAGTHEITIYGTGWDNTLQSKSFTLNVGGTGGCAAPASPGVNVCKPANGSTVGSPTEVQATANIVGMLARMEIWVDGVKMFTETTSTSFDTNVQLANGYHRFDIYAVNTAGTKYETTVYATVGAGNGCAAPSSPGVNVCSPTNGSTAGSPVTVTATANIAGTLARMEIWANGVKMFTETTSTSFSTQVSLSPGTYQVDIYAVNTQGTKYETTVHATVQ